MSRIFLAMCCVALAVPSWGSTINFTSLEAFVHAGGNPVPIQSLTSAGPGFVSLLNVNNLGDFQFYWTNLTGGPLSQVTFTIFLDADIDRDNNTYYNEFGEFVSNLLPILAPSGAIPFGAWEIDEPEYVFGNIYTNSLAGSLDNTNALPASGSPDDVSMALLFSFGNIGNGDVVRVTGRLSQGDAAGLRHVDPDSDIAFYFNGYGLVEPGSSSAVPEPSSGMLILVGLGVVSAVAKWRRLR
jgi:PEP-CTERM motif